MSGNLIGAILDTVTMYQNAKMRSYQNIHHIMEKEIEVQVPSTIERYTFKLNGWKIIDVNGELITIEKIQ